ncbi:20736_t:CDS:2 [Gigaspora rosea]|nr:20736_t:CDS:2 [Gigaspora rosea]
MLTTIRLVFKNGLATDTITAPVQTIAQVAFREILDEQFTKEAYATNFKSGPYTDYKMRLPPEMKERLTFQLGLGNVQTKAQFWQQISAIFHSL